MINYSISFMEQQSCRIASRTPDNQRFLYYQSILKIDKVPTQQILRYIISNIYQTVVTLTAILMTIMHILKMLVCNRCIHCRSIGSEGV